MTTKCSLCDNQTPIEIEVDILVGIITSTSPVFCEECYLSEDKELQKRIQEIEDNWGELPF